MRHCENLPEVHDRAWRPWMWFFASVSFVAGISLLAIGAFTVSKARQKAGLPFAVIPLLFGVHQPTNCFSQSKESTHGMAL